MIDFANELNPQQLAAVTHTDSPLLILAGAGSGKTRALIFRTAYLIQDHGVSPNNILLLTFTNKAAEEMQNRLRNLVDKTLPFAGTFHSFCAKFLRKEGLYVGLDTNYVIYDDSDQIDLIKHIAKDLDLPKQFKPRSLLSQIGAAKHELITPKIYAQGAEGYFKETVAQVYAKYQQTLTQNNALDFDDLLLKTVDVLNQNQDVRSKYQRIFSHVLIDEYQDTNKAQYLIAKFISDAHKQLTVVGDASQSIYRWRGADYRNLQALETDFPNLKTIRLEQNYRSSQPILDAAYAVIKNNNTHPILELWTDIKEGELLKLFEAQDEKDEAIYVMNKLNLSSEVSSAILYRTNAQSRAFEEVFIRYGIPYALVGGVSFYQRKEVKDILSYLRLIINPTDTVALSRSEKNGKRRLQQVLLLAKSLNHLQVMPVEIFDQVVQKTNFMAKFDPQNEADISRIENIKELRAVASQFETLTSFLENVALVEQHAKTDEAKKPVVTLMTIHAAKGLEFDQVFLVGLEEGVFPHSRSLLDPLELEEERRLCYVALTRARTDLHLSHARNRTFYGGFSRGVVSRFVGEIPEKLLESINPFQIQTPRTKLSATEDDLLDRFLADEIDIEEILS